MHNAPEGYISPLSYMQTFSTTIYPGSPQLPELTIIWMPRDENINVFSTTRALADELAEGEDDDCRTRLEIRDIAEGDRSLLESALVFHFKAGGTGSINLEDPPNYGRLATLILENAEIPVRASPLKGETLASLISGGGGTLGLIEIFHTGVTPTEAMVSVAFVAGATILLGAANAVRRAVEAGLELKLQSLFGLPDLRVIASGRTQATVNRRAKTRKQATADAKQATADAKEATAKKSPNEKTASRPARPAHA